MTNPGKVNKIKHPPYKLIGISAFVILLLVFSVVYLQFRGDFAQEDRTDHVQRPGRAGDRDPGSKVTYNGVQIGRVGKIPEISRDGRPAAKFTLEIYPQYLGAQRSGSGNVEDAQIKATTVFGGKYVSLTTPDG